MIKPTMSTLKNFWSYCHYLIVTSILFYLFPMYSYAEDWVDNFEISVSAGYGERSNPLLNSENIQTFINLDIAWYGDRFYFDNGDIGYNILWKEDFSVDLVGQLNNERVFFGKTNSRFISIGNEVNSSDPDTPVDDGMPDTELDEIKIPDRGYAYEAGIELAYQKADGQLQLAILQDISGQHQGQRVNLSYSHNHIRGAWFVQPAVGLSWKSQSLTDYYFGVRPEEATSQFDAYRADSSFSGFARVLINYAIGKNLFWGLALEYEALDNEISDSSIVTEHQVITAYTGIKYRF